MKENAVKNQSDTCTKTAGLSIAYTNNAIATSRLGSKKVVAYSNDLSVKRLKTCIKRKDKNTGACKSF